MLLVKLINTKKLKGNVSFSFIYLNTPMTIIVFYDKIEQLIPDMYFAAKADINKELDYEIKKGNILVKDAPAGEINGVWKKTVNFYSDLPASEEFDVIYMVLETNTFYRFKNDYTWHIEYAVTALSERDFIDNFTLSAGDITNKYILLRFTPSIKESTEFKITGIPQLYGTAFVVTNDNGGRRVSWEGYSLDGFLGIGDEIEIYYQAQL